MKQKNAQHTIGRPAKPRGQQTGFAGNPAKDRREKRTTPAVLGKRKEANKMAADRSSQHVGSDSVTPRTNWPSTPAMNPRSRKGESGGESGFKARLKKSRSTQ